MPDTRISPTASLTSTTAPTTLGGDLTVGDDLIVTDALDVTGVSTFTGEARFKGVPWFDVKAYGAVGDGTTNDTTAVQATFDAADTAGGGVVYFPAGTYICNSVRTGMTTDYIHIRGAGIGRTILKPNTNIARVLSLRSNGSVSDMTLDGNNQATNVLEGINDAGSGITITRQDFYRLHIKNSRTAVAGWVFIIWDVNQTDGFNEVFVNDVVVEGPSSSSQDSFAITDVKRAYFTNITFKDLDRHINFFWVNDLIIHGMIVQNCTNGVVVDELTDRASLHQVFGDTTTGALRFVARQTNEVIGGRWRGADVRVGQGTPLSIDTVRLVGFEMRRLLFYQSPAVRAQLIGCTFKPTAGDFSAIGDQINPGPFEHLHVIGCAFETSGFNWLSSAVGITWNDIKFADNRVTGSTISSVVFGTNCDFHSNDGYNPLGTAAITVTASPFTYTAGHTPEAVYIQGGTVSDISKNGRQIFTNTDKTVWLEPGEAVVVTYSVAPTMEKDRK